METLIEPSSPRAMKHSIWESTSKPVSKKHWSYKSHRRTPKITRLTLPAKRVPDGFTAFNGVHYDTFEAVKLAAKQIGFDFVRLGGLKFHV